MMIVRWQIDVDTAIVTEDDHYGWFTIARSLNKVGFKRQRLCLEAFLTIPDMLAHHLLVTFSDTIASICKHY
jgi:hypothetical protein